MNIALVTFRADPARGGAERYTADLAADLAHKGHAVSILATEFGSAIGSVEFVTVRHRAATRRGRYARFLDSLDDLLAQRRFEIVHAMLPVRRCDFYHPHAGLAVATVLEGHHKYNGHFRQTAARLANQLNFKRRLFADIERKLLNSPRPPAVLCLSDYVKRLIRRHYELPEDHLVTLFNGVDLARFDPAGPATSIPGNRIIAIMVAQDFARKGLRQAIEAIAQVNDPRFLLLVLGKDRPQPYAQLAERLGVAEQIQFVGQVDDPRPFYRAAHFFLLPTQHDPCSLATLEALAMGVPVISTTFNGACEVMQNGVHGFVLDNPRDVPALAACLRQMIDPIARRAMRDACLSLRPRLSFQEHVLRLLAIYQSFVGR